MNFVFKTRDLCIKNKEFVSKTKNCVFKMMDCAVNPSSFWYDARSDSFKDPRAWESTPPREMPLFQISYEVDSPKSDGFPVNVTIYEADVAIEVGERQLAACCLLLAACSLLFAPCSLLLAPCCLPTVNVCQHANPQQLAGVRREALGLLRDRPVCRA